MAQGFTLFDTAIGQCGIAWDGRTVIGSQLPEGSAERTRARLERRFPGAVEHDPPGTVRRAIAAVTALLSGEGAAPLAEVPLDLSRVPRFHARVYEVARTIPPGTTLTYGEIARRLGEPGAARAVGQALGANPFAPIVPCHRVLAADGGTGGFSANGGVATKRRMLEIEGVYLEEPTLFDV
ncbi:methylated-DNA--[protein]-cysteine S-methyltransferase [Prauserella oleivorans]|uniref:Methylated-DNA--[protein]-cysteine S-methyltransferase n=1 Tax=Prauserella oleivorans TaxID=1478153 RepID=A0ABW5WC61_9PSEU